MSQNQLKWVQINKNVNKTLSFLMDFIVLMDYIIFDRFCPIFDLLIKSCLKSIGNCRNQTDFSQSLMLGKGRWLNLWLDYGGSFQVWFTVQVRFVQVDKFGFGQVYSLHKVGKLVSFSQLRITVWAMLGWIRFTVQARLIRLGQVKKHRNSILGLKQIFTFLKIYQVRLG